MNPIEIIEKILSEYKNEIDRLEFRKKELIESMKFLKKHGFNEELRIKEMLHNEIDLYAYSWRLMYNELYKVVNDAKKV